MRFNKFKKILLSIIFSILSFLIIFKIFFSVFTANEIIITYGIHPFNIYEKNLELWNFFKFAFVFTYIFSNFIIFYFIFSKIFHTSKKKPHRKTIKNNYDLTLNIGFNKNNELIKIPEKSLYQNILITGTIGTGKTSSAMYPFTKQLIEYKSNSTNEKLGMLILDVKGNYIYQVLKYAKLYNREDDIIPIQISGNFNYNPLDNISLKPSVLANRLKTILLLFSPNNTESYWIDKSESVLSEAIKLCRLYNNGYVTFQELHNIITSHDYYSEKVDFLRQQFIEGKFSNTDTYNLLSALNFFEKEFFCLDSRTFNILKSEITRITTCFISDPEVLKTFCPKRSDNNFPGFQNIIKNGKIVILNMNINEYKNLSKIIATYLKLDFQTEVLRRLANNLSPLHPVAFISDEYSEYVSATDANFFSQSRESKCINIVSTQGYTSLLNALNNKYSVEVIVQNLVNKLWFRSDDIFTIEDAQKQLRKS